MQKKALNLTEGKIWKVLLAFLMPILLGSLIQQLYTTIDAIIVGQYIGRQGLAAIDSVATLFKFPINFLTGLSSGTSIVISSYYGKRDEHSLHSSIRVAYLIAIILGTVFSVLGFIFTPVLLKWMLVPEDIFSLTETYVRIYFIGIFAMFIYNMIAGILRALGNSKITLYILLVSCVVNIAGDYLLIVSLNMGVAGAAIATVAAQIISALLAIIALKKVHSVHTTNRFSFKTDMIFFKEIFRLGIPMALQSMLYPVANSLIHANINKMGTDIIAAWSVSGKLDMFIWLIADAMSPALSTFVAQNYGAEKKDRVTKGTYLGAAISAGLVGLISLALFIIPDKLGMMFIAAEDVDAVLPHVIMFTRMMAPFYIFYTFNESFSGACCGLGDTVTPMINSLVFTCLLRIVSILFILPAFNSMSTIVWIYIASWIATGISFILLFHIKKKKYLKQNL